MKDSSTVSEKKRKVLYVRTLGMLDIRYDGDPLDIPILSGGKVIQLLLLLVWAGMEGIGRVKLQDLLYDRSNTNVANALRITASRLRKLISQTELPEDEYVVIQKGVYYLKKSEEGLTVQMDAALMEDCCARASRIEDEAERLRLLEQGCSLYGGEFLPALSGEVWVEILRSRYQNVYIKSAKETCALMQKNREYEKILRLCDTAIDRCPIPEWIEYKVGALLALKCYGDALKAYEQAADKFIDGTGGVLPEHMLTWFKQLGRQIQHLPAGMEEIQKELEEDGRSAGAYYCTYPGFVDCFRMSCQGVERGKREGILIICTIRDARDSPVEDREKLQTYSDILGGVIHQSLRRGDIYTKYSPDQMLIMANDLREDKVGIVVNRIVSGMRRKCGQKVRLQIESINLEKWSKKWKES